MTTSDGMDGGIQNGRTFYISGMGCGCAEHHQQSNPYGQSFNFETGETETTYQLGIFPVMQYRITF